MVKQINARFLEGVIVPLEPLDIEEGAELSVTVVIKPNLSRIEEKIEVFKSSGGWSDSIDGEELKKTLYDARRIGSRETPEL